MTTFYGLWLSHHFTYITNYKLSNVETLWQLSCTASTPVFLTCGLFYLCCLTQYKIFLMKGLSPKPNLRETPGRSSILSPGKVASQFFASFGAAAKTRSFRKSNGSSPDLENGEKRKRKRKVVQFPDNPVARGLQKQKTFNCNHLLQVN